MIKGTNNRVRLKKVNRLVYFMEFIKAYIGLNKG